MYSAYPFLYIIFIIAVIIILYILIKIVGKKTSKPSTESIPNVSELVILPAGYETNGLGMIFGKLFRQILEKEPERMEILKKMNAAIGVQDTTDEKTAVTMTFKDCRIIVENGIIGSPDIYIAGDLHTLVALPSVGQGMRKIFLTPEGRRILRRFINGELRIRGVLSHLSDFRRYRQLVK